jgi:glycosyltransferase involved in cell wall biosynthesis
MRRVAFINPCAEIGGAERALLLLLQGLDRDRFAPTVICPAAGRLAEACEALGVPTRIVPLGRAERLSRFSGRVGVVAGSWTGLSAVGAAAGRLVIALRQLKPDLIHTNGIKAHVIGGLCGKALGRSVLWHMRDLVADGAIHRLLGAAADRLPRRIVAVSGIVAEQFAGRPGHAKTRIVHDGVDLERYRPTRSAAAVREELCLPDSALVLAMVAHFTAWKGHLLFLEILERLTAEGRPVVGLVIGGSIYVGDGHKGYEGAVRDRARALGLNGRVHFTGFKECVADYLAASDLLVHPPLRPEPFGLAVIEAMALGKPVVAAAAGGVLETVEPGVTGLPVPPGDAAAFTAAIRSLAEDPARRARMGAAGRERVTRMFASGLHVARMERVFEETIGSS